MKIVAAAESDFETVKDITQQTIRAVYPHYYPTGAVDFFLTHHSDESILRDIRNGDVFLLYTDSEQAAGTVTTEKNEINRLFVLPEYQGRGFGGALLRFAEERIAENYHTAELSVSLPAKAIYLKYGYTFKEYCTIKTKNGDYLCFDNMEKPMLKQK
ncbi:GNAT family N-acetyltransferase [Ruminococcus sp.]|uniref:GNAT family N-acetyltransferase n=1 Tax=Ruminococcus sp. TaxID=41978 RepID=UPI0025ED3A73|nr:GNAT family N-acetyltransferase [Ruminococcus sp.]MCR4638192.1 GNAT family N-acetyltransferase [Ruminococcus sp.]